jgi:DNA-binding MarR family transcriptional regulator
MTVRPQPQRDDTQRLLVAAQQRMHNSRTMVAWSIARLFATNPDLQPAETAHDVLLNLLGCPCDLDVLIFFLRHPRVLLTLDDLAARVGYDVHDVGASIAVLAARGLLEHSKDGAERRQSEAVLYRFTLRKWDAIRGPLLYLASSADGRRSLRRALTHMSGGDHETTTSSCH